MATTDADRILSAIAALSDRTAAIERRLERIETSCAATERHVEKVDHKVNALLREQLTPGECVALGVPDARPGAAPFHPPLAIAE